MHSTSMSSSPSRHQLSAVVAQLRSAGCVFAEDEARLLMSAAMSPGDLDDMIEQRVDGQPLEHVLGWAEFCGLEVSVDRGVFVPRRRTELLVREAAAVAVAKPHPVVLDLCCGSGAIGAALAAVLSGIQLYCVDIDPVAVACTCRNIATARGKAYVGDLYEPLPAALRGNIDILVANAPYVPTDAIGSMPPEARLHEPRVALDGGADGLDILRKVIVEAPTWLAPGGSLLFETSSHQTSAALDAVAAYELTPRLATSAELDATVVIATRPVRP